MKNIFLRATFATLIVSLIAKEAMAQSEFRCELAENSSAIERNIPTAVGFPSAQCTLPELTFQFDNTIPNDQRELIREAVADAVQFYCRKTGYSTGPIDTFVLANNDKGYTGEAGKRNGRGVINIYTLNPGWLTSAPWMPLPARRRYIVAHEVFHILQFDLSGLIPLGIPPWLQEGSADYMGFRTIDNNGLYSFALTTFDKTIRSRLISTKLESLTFDLNDVYQLGTRGVIYLMSNSTISSLTKFHQNLATKGWQESFQDAFRFSSGMFYQQFEEHRNNTFPPLLTKPFGITFDAAYPQGFYFGVAPNNVPHLLLVTGISLNNIPQSSVKLPSGTFWGIGGWETMGFWIRDSATSGNYKIEIQLPDGRQAETTIQHIATSGVPIPSPTITSLNPTLVNAGSTGLWLSINGSGFVYGSTGNWNGSPRFTRFRSDKLIEIASTGADIAEIGTASITVTNPGSSGNTSNSQTVTILPQRTVSTRSPIRRPTNRIIEP